VTGGIGTRRGDMSLPATQKFCQSPFAYGEISRRACAGTRDGKIVSAINAAGAMRERRVRPGDLTPRLAPCGGSRCSSTCPPQGDGREDRAAVRWNLPQKETGLL
jgi:hypothetical protein